MAGPFEREELDDYRNTAGRRVLRNLVLRGKVCILSRRLLTTQTWRMGNGTVQWLRCTIKQVYKRLIEGIVAVVSG